jgi:hypothetical protein
MKKNVGSADMVIRILIAVVIAILLSTGSIKGPWAVILGIVGGIALLTGLFNRCPLYMLFGFSSCPVKKRE